MAGSPRATALRGFSAFEKEGLEGEARAYVLLEVAERVVRQLEEPGPLALRATAAGEHPAPQLDLPAGHREERGILLVALASPPAHLLRVQLRRDVQRHVRRRAEDLLQASRPLQVQIDHAVVMGAAHRPAR